jgi:bifunctional non-homologous end joining protein LigD
MLTDYTRKRDFTRTPEPKGRARAAGRRRSKALSFVVQKHAATRLHYDFRLELDGVLLSWAVPKGPSLDPSHKRMAVHVEDHPLDYGGFEGTIPPKQYGAGHVIVWDRGTWEPVGDAHAGLAKGHLVFRLHGEKLAGEWHLVRTARPGDRQEPWMLIKRKDEWARSIDEEDVITRWPDSVIAHPLGLREEREGAAAPQAPAPEIDSAPKAALPKALKPQLATLVDHPPAGGDWIVEPKWDGYRLLVRIDRGEARLFTRTGLDWTDRMPSLAQALQALQLAPSWLDGEIVVLGDNGLPSFNALQLALDGSTRQQRIVYCVFDLAFHDGRDLRGWPLRERRALLQSLLPTDPQATVRFSAEFPAPPAEVYEAACRLELEGLMLKRADAPYQSSRTTTWLKLKCQRRQDFVIGGYTDRTNGPGEVGALILGVYDDEGRLHHAGRVGTGWNSATGRALHQRLSALRRRTPAFETAAPAGRHRRSDAPEHWVDPTLVAEVAFGEWTPDGIVRHAVFQGLREDLPARQVRRERQSAPPQRRGAVKATAKATAKTARAAPALKITHGERVIDPASGITKRDLVRYYEQVAERMLPHLKDRPLSLVRAPQGMEGQRFFQKHLENTVPGIVSLDPALWPGHAALFAVEKAEGIVGAAQLNAVEFHTWNALARRIDRPDRIVFDLDPGEGTPWPQIREAALLTHAVLDELGLVAFLKTSGGKGLHVVVPLTPRLGWDEVKGFSQAVVQHLARTLPQRFVAKSGPANRVGKIFVDYLRNGHGATTATAFSARLRPGMGVSMPLAWDELESLKRSDQWTVRNALDRLSFVEADPWADYGSTRQTLTAAKRKLAAVTGR